METISVSEKQSRNWLIQMASKPLGKGDFFIQKICREKMNPVRETGLFYIFPGNLQLAGQIHNGDLNIRGKARTGNRPFSGIATNIQNFFYSSCVYFG